MWNLLVSVKCHSLCFCTYWQTAPSFSRKCKNYLCFDVCHADLFSCVCVARREFALKTVNSILQSEVSVKRLPPFQKVFMCFANQPTDPTTLRNCSKKQNKKKTNYIMEMVILYNVKTAHSIRTRHESQWWFHFKSVNCFCSLTLLSWVSCVHTLIHPNCFI